MENLTTLVSSIIALSVAAERVVEIIKGVFVWLDKEKDDPKIEARRRAALQALAAAAGVGVSVMAWPVTKTQLPADSSPTLTIIALGLLASGGSGFWNSILGYMTSLKALKSAVAEAATKAAELPGTTALPQPAGGRFLPAGAR